MKTWTSRVIKISLREAIHPPTGIMKMVAKQLRLNISEIGGIAKLLESNDYYTDKS